jgi:predicted ArsR family transcriptional regulator
VTEDTRQQIILYLKRQGESSIAEMSRALKLTSVTIRHHIDALRQSGLVDNPSARKKDGPGRPELVYHLTSAADKYLPRNYAELSIEMIKALSRPALAKKPAEVFRSAGISIGQQAAAVCLKSNANPEEFTVSFLEDRGYFPVCIRDESGLSVRLSNCPYLELAQQHPATCLLDHAIIEGIFGSDVAMKGRIIQGEAVCSFRIREDRPIDMRAEG